MRLRLSITFALLVCFIFNSKARTPEKGYRGFIDWSNSIAWTNRLDHNGEIHKKAQWFSGISTSHGVQINSNFFAGAGIGIELNPAYSNSIIPLYADIRGDFSFSGKFTPYADLRLGANLAEGAGVYISPSIGYRFNWGRKVNFNIGVGMSLAGYRLDNYEIIFKPSDFGGEIAETIYKGKKNFSRVMISMRAGFDF